MFRRLAHDLLRALGDVELEPSATRLPSSMPRRAYAAWNPIMCRPTRVALGRAGGSRRACRACPWNGFAPRCRP